MIDLERREEFPAAALADRLLAWTAPARAALGGSSRRCRRENGAQRQRAALAGGHVDARRSSRPRSPPTQRTYASEGVTT